MGQNEGLKDHDLAKPIGVQADEILFHLKITLCQLLRYKVLVLASEEHCSLPWENTKFGEAVA